MKKLVDLTNEQLLSGRTRGKFMPGGLWDTAPGLNPFIESDTYRGTLAVTAAPTDKTGSVVVDNPIAYAKDEQNSTYNMYIMGDGGHFYRVTVNEVVSDLRSGTPINAPANGMAIFRPRAASTPTLLFARETRIGTWDLSGTYATGWDDGAYNPGTTTPHRPFHPLFDRVYYGNKNAIGEFSDDGTATIAHTANALDLEPQETVTALEDDGRYLVIATSRTVQESYNGASRVRIVFWDTNSDSWDWETTIPNEFSIRGMKRVGNVIHAVGKRGLYELAFGLAPRMIEAFDSDETIAFDATSYGHPQSIGAWGDGVIFGKLATAYSRFLPGANRITYNPLQGFTGDIGLIAPDFLENKVYVGTRSAKLYSFDMTAAGYSSTAFLTRYIDLQGYYHVKQLDITLPNGPTGTITITVSGTDATNVSDTITINATKYPGKRYLSIPLSRNITTPHVRLSITMSAGTPSFSALSLWGEPAAASN